jgi:ribosome-associated protein
LDHFLKLTSLTETGGQAKLLIQDGQVKVNGDIETRRSRKLAAGDVVEVNGETFTLDDVSYDS